VTNNEFGESYYNPMIPSVIQELEEKGLIKVDNGAKCLFIPKVANPLIVQKSDGGYGYDTTDLAAARHRLVTIKADRVVILTDIGQGPHFHLIFKAAELAGWATVGVQKQDHMGFGLILKADGSKMSTSQGGNVKLGDLLDEARDRAAIQIRERLSGDNESAKTKLDEEDILRVAEIMGVSAVKYYDMRQSRT
jgi:arginyl-tRNA synthetase